MIRVTTDAGRVAAELAGMAPSLQPELAKVTRSSGAALLRAVKSNAPRQTGRYARSWRMQFSGNPAVAVATVGTNEPYGYVLEMGDGEKPPQPHVQPALAEVTPVFVAQVKAAVDDWLAKPPTINRSGPRAS